ncbi:unnamed protein product, partial [Ectocarpus sp. 12 AP-2014]
LQERLAHLLDRGTLQGQRRELQNLICPSNLVIPRELLRTVPCIGDGDCGYHSLLNGLTWKEDRCAYTRKPPNTSIATPTSVAL